MANDTDDTNFPDKEYREVLNQFAYAGPADRHRIQQVAAEANAIPTKHFSSELRRLSDTIGTSAKEVTRGTEVIKEAIEEFNTSATAYVRNLSGALNNFRDSMDKSSGQMWWLTLWLVIFTAVLALFTGMLAFKEVDLFGGAAKTTFLKQSDLRQLNR